MAIYSQNLDCYFYSDINSAKINIDKWFEDNNIKINNLHQSQNGEIKICKMSAFALNNIWQNLYQNEDFDGEGCNLEECIELAFYCFKKLNISYNKNNINTKLWQFIRVWNFLSYTGGEDIDEEQPIDYYEKNNELVICDWSFKLTLNNNDTLTITENI